MKKFLKNKKGQSSVEYMLMIAASVSLIISISGRMREYLVGVGNCPNQSYLCQMIDVFDAPGFMSGDYRRFTLRR